MSSLVVRDAISRRLETFTDKSIASDSFDDGRVYIVTNEAGSKNVSEFFRKNLPLRNGRCHIGFSSLHNFNIMAQRRSDRGVIIDINPINSEFLRYVLQLLCKEGITRQEFCRLLPQFFEDRQYLHPDVREVLDQQLTSPHSWLSTDCSFQHIRRLALRGRIALITANICDTRMSEKIRQLFNSRLVDTIYLSNISFFINTEKERQDFLITLDNFSSPSTLVVFAKKVQVDVISIVGNYMEMACQDVKERAYLDTNDLFDQGAEYIIRLTSELEPIFCSRHIQRLNSFPVTIPFFFKRDPAITEDGFKVTERTKAYLRSLYKFFTTL